MQELVSCAISIDDVRDIFGADPQVAEALRGLAATPPRPSPTQEKGWLRPLLRRDRRLEVDVTAPSAEDVDALLAGAHIPPDRVAPSWRILTDWVEKLAVRSSRVPWDQAGFDALEWNLARSGLNSDFSLRRLADRDLGIPLRPLPGQVAGYAKHGHAFETLRQLRSVHGHPELSSADRALLAPILTVLDAVATDASLDIITMGATA